MRVPFDEPGQSASCPAGRSTVWRPAASIARGGPGGVDPLAFDAHRPAVVHGLAVEDARGLQHTHNRGFVSSCARVLCAWPDERQKATRAADSQVRAQSVSPWADRKAVLRYKLRGIRPAISPLHPPVRDRFTRGSSKYSRYLGRHALPGRLAASVRPSLKRRQVGARDRGASQSRAPSEPNAGRPLAWIEALDALTRRVIQNPPTQPRKRWKPGSRRMRPRLGAMTRRQGACPPSLHTPRTSERRQDTTQTGARRSARRVRSGSCVANRSSVADARLSAADSARHAAHASHG